MSYNRSGSGLSKGFGFPGFVLPKKDSPHAGAAIPPPPQFRSSGPGLSKQGYSTMNAISQTAMVAQSNWASMKKRARTEDEYFDDDEDANQNANRLEYIPGKPTVTCF